MDIFTVSELFLTGLLLMVLFVGGFAAHKFKIPDVIIFLFSGLALGLFMQHSDLMEFAAEVGIVMLFFMLGMEFPIQQLRYLAMKIYKPGLIDLALSFGVSTAIALLFGLDLPSALLVGGVAYATSSSITAKLLEKNNRLIKNDADFLLGVLIFEDIIAPILVAVVASMYLSGSISPTEMIFVFVKIIILIIGALAIGKVIFSNMKDFIDHYVSEDFFILFVVGLGLLYAGLALSLGLSEVLGAFLAGIMLAESQQSSVLQNQIRNLRDLLMPVFFIYFGTTIDILNGIPMLGLLLVLLTWSIASKIVVGIYGGRQYGLNREEALRAGLSFTQRGEFSIIIAALATSDLKTFSGIFILFSALIGVIMFQNATKWAKRIVGPTKLNS
ncbi:cation:proton antiporter [Salinicoccus sp. CNSTN-B1]